MSNPGTLDIKIIETVLFESFQMKPISYGEEGLNLEYRLISGNGRFSAAVIFSSLVSYGSLSINIKCDEAVIASIYSEKILFLNILQDKCGQGIIVGFDIEGLCLSAKIYFMPSLKFEWVLEDSLFTGEKPYLRYYPSELDFMLSFSLESVVQDESESFFKYIKSTIDNAMTFEVSFDVKKSVLNLGIYDDEFIIYSLLYKNIESINIYDEKNGKGIRVATNNNKYNLRIDFFVEPHLKYFFSLLSNV